MQMNKSYKEWSDLYKPQGEFISSLVAPQNFESYLKVKTQKEKIKKSGGVDIIKTKDGESATASAHFNPQKGLVDSSGKVIMSTEEYMKRTNIEGVMVSY